MQSLEIEAKTIDEAIEKACIEFKAPREKLHIEIISSGSTGFLGILGSKKAKIKASMMAALNIDAPFEQPQAAAAEHDFNQTEPVMSDLHEDSDGDFAVRSKTLLEGILQRMDLSCTVTTEDTTDTIILNIHGDGSGLLIGKRGQNLDAIQYIVNKASSRFANGHKMVVIDTEDYRKRREESLVAMAEKLAEKVKKTRKPITLSHLNAHDRRIIHLALQKDTSLATKSRGEGDYRKIVIMPARKG